MNKKDILKPEASEKLNKNGDEAAAVIPVIEEQVQVGKKVVETGRVRITKRVTEHDEVVKVPVISDEVHVERVPVNQYVSAPPPAVRYEGDTMVIPVLREVLVVEKRLLVVEELRITKRQIETDEQQEVTLRKEEVKVERNEQKPDNHTEQKSSVQPGENTRNKNSEDNESFIQHLI